MYLVSKGIKNKDKTSDNNYTTKDILGGNTNGQTKW